LLLQLKAITRLPPATLMPPQLPPVTNPTVLEDLLVLPDLLGIPVPQA